MEEKVPEVQAGSAVAVNLPSWGIVDEFWQKKDFKFLPQIPEEKNSGGDLSGSESSASDETGGGRSTGSPGNPSQISAAALAAAREDRGGSSSSSSGYNSGSGAEGEKFQCLMLG